MSLELRDVTVRGTAMPKPFVESRLERLLVARRLLTVISSADAAAQAAEFQRYRLNLARLNDADDGPSVFDKVLGPLAELLGYAKVKAADPVSTREGDESGGFLFETADGAQKLRVWAGALGSDLDAPSVLGQAYRYRAAATAQRVLLSKAESVGLLSNGLGLRIVLSDPSGQDSHLSIDWDGPAGWRSAVVLPDSFRLVHALCSPAGVTAVPELVEQARLAQNGVRKKLREQARRAVEQFIQGLIDAPENRAQRELWTNHDATARQLWHEGLIVVYRILFILKLESVTDPACRFSFTATDAWRQSLSPSCALLPLVEAMQDQRPRRAASVASSLRELFRLLSTGKSATGLCVAPLGGALFGAGAIPLLESLEWSDRVVAILLDALLWITSDSKAAGSGGTLQRRERVHYAALEVEDLGSVYEALLELEPGISSEPMCRLRRSKLEVVVPLAQAARRRSQSRRATDPDDCDAAARGGDDGTKSKVTFVEEIPAQRFYLRVGLGRKASGAFYTPHAFVRYLVQETLGPQLAKCSPSDDPEPLGILKLKVLDPTMGSGHFLVESCRYLGEALYEACRLCEDLAQIAERELEVTTSEVERSRLSARARDLRKRIQELPELSAEFVRRFPPALAPSAESSAVHHTGIALCRRLIATNCLYGIDKNPLAVELARVALWLGSYAEGLPLTFAEHHIVQGDSVTGADFVHLLTMPCSGRAIGEMQAQAAAEALNRLFAAAIVQLKDPASADGLALEDQKRTRIARQRYDDAIKPLRLLAAAWSGGVMLGKRHCDGEYLELLLSVARGDEGPSVVESRPLLQKMIDLGRDGIPFDLHFPEVFYPNGLNDRRGGFDAVLGNPPWDAIKFNTKEFLAAFDLRVLEAPTKTERDAVELALTKSPAIGDVFRDYREEFECLKRSNDRLYQHQKIMIDGDLAGRQLDLFRVLVERGCQLLCPKGYLGFVVPSAFHTAAGAAGVRQLVSGEHRLIKYVSFLNTRRLFDITPSFEFGLLVAGGTDVVGVETFARFGLTDPALLASTAALGLLRYPTGAICQGNPYHSFPTVHSEDALEALVACKENRRNFHELQSALGIEIRSTPSSVHMTHEAKYFARVSTRAESLRHIPELGYAAALSSGAAVLHEGATFHRYTDDWAESPRFSFQAARLATSERWKALRLHYKLALRAIVGSSSEKCIAAILPPGCLVSNSALVEGAPESRATCNALKLLALLNATTFNWLLSFHADLNVNLFALKYLPVPKVELPEMLAHGALRLSCNHEGYRGLWQEQLRGVWREASQAESWPVLSGDALRWAVRAQLDAVVATIYGLSRPQYEHVLASFGDSGYRGVSKLCLVAFDEIETRGLDAFAQTHDPYWDVPPVTTPPTPAAVDSVSTPTQTRSGHSGSTRPVRGGRPSK